MATDILGSSWNISLQGYDLITENNTITDKSRILTNALNADLKEIANPTLDKILSKSNNSQVILQIQKIRNISAPKANENSHTAPRMLKLVLTDGDTYIQGIETATISSLSHENTPPGSKLLIKSPKIASGYLLLDSNNCSFLGGKVPALYEKWQVAKSVQNHRPRNTSSDGPPGWVNFGCKIQSEFEDRNFKSLNNQDPDVKEDTKFDLQRQDAIAEAASGAVKKVFGGGVKQAVQSHVDMKTKIVGMPVSKDKKYQKLKTIGIQEMDEKPQKPSERVSLFDFLEDKLPTNEIAHTVPVKPYLSNNNFKVSHINESNNTNYNNFSSKTSYSKFEHYQNNDLSNWKSEIKPKVPKHKSGNESEPSELSNNFAKMSLNTQFATRSLKQHLNLSDSDKSTSSWKVGDDCKALYWEDKKYYDATITAVTDKTCVVKFKGYGNLEEVLKTDCFPVHHTGSGKRHTGSTEFRTSKTYRRQY